ncbi:unnamed protein product [Agarophyton chilense]|eukprot:gb/GEZJ01001277.1/.p1 GENE.gb/GEZJ01001277.1/~~gb/GEZJ01001277.1/.p1  ORF type:complete len:1324 (-),score=165.40 gb/GEZJ01001277.1/:6795-10766(-)
MARKRRKRRFARIPLLEHEGASAQQLMKEAREDSQVQQERRNMHEKAQAANIKFQEDAERVTELYISRVPRAMSAASLVRHLLVALCRKGYMTVTQANTCLHDFGSAKKKPVLRCEICPENPRYNNSIAFVLVASKNIAELLVRCSPYAVNRIERIIISMSRRSATPTASAWHPARDPGSSRWNIFGVRTGERIDASSFCAFWSSPQNVNLIDSNVQIDSHVQLSPVAGSLIITIPRKMPVLKGNNQLVNMGQTQTNDFDHALGMLRFEIPFRSICDAPRAVISRQDDDRHAIVFSISRPPLLFRSCEESTQVLPRFWDFLGGSERGAKWVRTVDPTKSFAFSRTRAIRIEFSRDDMRCFYEKLQHLYLTKMALPVLVINKIVREKHPPDQHSIFRIAANTFHISFSVRYAVACILSLGTVRIAEVDSEFWHAVNKMTEDEALSVLECMLYRLSSDEAYTSVNELLPVLTNTMELLNIVGTRQSRSEHSSDCGEYDSDGTEDTEEIIMERYVDELRLDELSIDDTHQQGKPSSIHTSTTVQPSKKKRPSKQQTHIRKVIVTPTRKIALKAEPDLLNRVLRKFSEHKHRFIRVAFTDEDGRSVGYSGSEDLLCRIRAALRNGIRVAGERFVFLAFSNSQLRDHSAWMYNETPNATSIPPSADDIRAWMGNFSEIRIPGKYAARQGQVFSSSLGTLELGPDQEEVVSDIVDSRGEHLFSDGIGIVSPNLAKAMTKKLRIERLIAMPSAFQIRYGGAKGMLAVWDSTILPRRHGVEVSLRPSMKKFKSSHRVLEVVSIAKCLPLFLNRQIIMVLSGLGVPDMPFEKLQETFLKRLDMVMEKDGKITALQVLNASGCGANPDRKLKSNSPMMSAVDLFLAGLNCHNCEYLFNIMNAFRQRMISGVRHRARIPLDRRQGICAIGVLDELGVLKPGEIFCQFRDPSYGKVVATGQVTVGRSPCLHPGDIQPANAVQCESLRHMVDVIVFPRTGRRPLPSMLGGGDLDGDIFFCIFEKTIAYPRSQPYPAMVHKSPDPQELDHDVQVSDVADFFVQYIRNDKLGLIANAHLVHADKEQAGIFSEKCLDLAILHSTAVDFPKTGIPALVPPDLALRNQKNQYPDFMMKHKKISYKSTKILGKLFRACNASRSESKKELVTFPNESSYAVVKIFSCLSDDAELERESDSHCNSYNYEIKRLMDHYGVQSEGELVSGQVLSFTSRITNVQWQREYMDQLMRMNRETNELRSQFRELFFEGLGQRPGSKYNIDTITKASAWYNACEKQAAMDRKQGRKAFLSFPWVVSDVLLHWFRAYFCFVQGKKSGNDEKLD